MIIGMFLRTAQILYLIFKVNKTEAPEDIKSLRDATLKSSPICIKFIQFLASYDGIFNENISSQLSDVFENCKVHDIAYTKQAFFEDFGKDFDDEYIVDESVQSGSIGQVYKAYSKKLNRYVAIKAKHPRIDKEVRNFTKCLRLSINIIAFFVKMGYIHLFTEFIENINLQLDFYKEAENIKRLGINFADTKCVTIPTVFEVSNRFVIMSYHTGKNINDIEDTTLKLKVSMYLNLFVLSSILVHNFLHSDLHCGNWKVDLSEEDPKIIVYDCGIFMETSDSTINKTIIGFILESNFVKLVDYAAVEKGTDIDKLRSFIQTVQDNDDIPSSKRLKIFLQKVFQSKVKVDQSIIRLIQGLTIVSKNLEYSVDTLTDNFKQYRDRSKTLLLFAYVCVTYNSGHFMKLHEFYKKWIEDEGGHVEAFLNWLKVRYGHQETDIFYESLCDIFDLNYKPLNYPDVYLI